MGSAQLAGPDLLPICDNMTVTTVSYLTFMQGWQARNAAVNPVTKPEAATELDL